MLKRRKKLTVRQVLDSWDAAEDSEEEREKAAAAAAAAKAKAAEASSSAPKQQKKSKSQRIEEHQEERRRQKEKAEEEEEEGSSEEDEDEATRRVRLRKTEKDADLKHAEDLFGDIDINRTQARSAPRTVVVEDGGAGGAGEGIDLSAMALFKPTTKDQFTRLSNTLVPLLLANSKKPQFSLWVQDFTKQLLRGLPSAEVKKVASALTTMSNEKMREEKSADKGSKKTKAAKTKVSLVASRADKVDTNAYDDDGLGDDDFM